MYNFLSYKLFYRLPIERRVTFLSCFRNDACGDANVPFKSRTTGKELLFVNLIDRCIEKNR